MMSFKHLLLLLCSGVAVNAFTPSSFTKRPASTFSRQFSTPSDDINPAEEDDELSKLIGKRSEIKRKKKMSEQPIETVEFDISENDIEWDKMPEFKTSRPTRASKKKASEEKDKKPKDTGADLDFLADYDDENDFHIPNRIGFTTSAWGEPSRGFVSGGKLTKKMRREGKFVPGDLQVAYNTLLENGISLVETSEKYGSGSRSASLSAEHILGRSMEEQRSDNQPLVIATFSNPFPSLRIGAKAVVAAMEASNKRMETSGIEVLQVQSASPIYPGGRRSLAKGLAQAVDKGYANHVGACNLGKYGLKAFAKKLENQGLTLTSNQFEFSLTNRKAWKSGLIDYCKEQGVIPLVSNPLDDGLASGKFTATNPSGGEAGGAARFPFAKLEKLQPLHSVQETVAERASTRVKRESQDLKERYRRGAAPKINSDITTTQVAINYVIAKGAVPLVDVSDSRQADELLGCIGWGLSEEEVEMLDAAASLCGL